MLDELKQTECAEKALLSRHILWSTSAHKAFADDAFYRVRIALLVQQNDVVKTVSEMHASAIERSKKKFAIERGAIATNEKKFTT